MAGRRKGDREKVDRSPGKQGGASYVRRDEQGKFTDGQDEIGKSISTDMRNEAEHQAPRGQKDRGD